MATYKVQLTSNFEDLKKLLVTADEQYKALQETLDKIKDFKVEIGTLNLTT